MTEDDINSTESRGPSKALLGGLGAALVLSVIGNVIQLMQPPPPPPPPPPRVAAPTCPPAPVCPTCPVCEACEECPWPEPPPPRVGGGGPRPPRVDENAAAEGEAHLAHAEQVGDRDPVQLAAQRRLADGVDRIVASHSPRSAQRFIQRNLPSLASMDCAFRDPAAAEHVRMRIREMNELLPQDQRLTEEQITRYERDLRCPRE